MALLSNLPELAAQARQNLALLPRAKRSGSTDTPVETTQRQLASRLQEQLLIPTAVEPPEESTRVRAQDRGQFLARQERWEELSRLIRAADNRKVATHCGMPHADLLSLGGFQFDSGGDLHPLPAKVCIQQFGVTGVHICDGVY